MVDRKCGGCAACCIAPEIPELGKAAGVPCQHLRDAPAGGQECSIWGKPERPAICNAFVCTWKQGMGMSAERPDRIGVMLYDNPANSAKFRRACYTAAELCPGGFDAMRARLFLETALERRAVILANPDGSGRLLVPHSRPLRRR